MEEEFINAIHSKNKISVTFYSQKDEGITTRTCAPMDIGPKARVNDGIDRYHMWNYTSPSGPHTVSLTPDQITNIQVLDEKFEPSEFVKWSPSWHISRDWGQFS